MGGSLSTTNPLGGAALSPVRGREGTVHDLHEAARNRQSEPCAWTNVVTLLHPIEFVEDALEIVSWNTGTFIEDLQTDRIPFAPDSNADRGARWRVFGRVIQQVEQDLLEKNRINAYQP